MLIANHPNDLPDVMLGYLSTPRDVHFIATISAATNAMARATYRGLGVIPVTRASDARKLLQQGATISDANRVAYRRVVAGMGDGYLIGVFPEGGVNVGYGLGNFRSGVAQMLLQCFDDGALDRITVMPFGLQYEDRDRPDSDVIALCGPPLSVDRKAVTQSANRVERLTALLQTTLSRVTRAGRSESERYEIDVLAAATGALLAKHARDGFLRAAIAAPRISRVVQERGDDVVAAIAAAQELGRIVEALGGAATSAIDVTELHVVAETAVDRTSVADNASSVRTRAFPPSPSFTGLRDGHPATLALVAPVAFAGWIMHAPLRAFIWWYALRTAEDRAYRVGRAVLPGLYIVFGWYFLLTALAAVVLSLSGFSSLYAVLLFVLLFRLGDVAVRWRHGFNAWRYRRRLRALAPAVLEDVRHRFAQLHRWWAAQPADITEVTPTTVQVIA